VRIPRDPVESQSVSDNTRRDLEELMMGLHDGLEELFHRHRVALLDRDVRAAREWLARYREGLLAHMADEEEHILPAYAARGGAATNSPPEQFLAEHRKLRDGVARLEEATRDLGDAPADRPLLDLLDREASFRSLMEHHDLRERRVLYPRLREWLDEREAAALMGAIRLHSL
jgi:hemerythrin-like domain-containing protein